MLPDLCNPDADPDVIQMLIRCDPDVIQMWFSISMQLKTCLFFENVWSRCYQISALQLLWYCLIRMWSKMLPRSLQCSTIQRLQLYFSWMSDQMIIFLASLYQDVTSKMLPDICNPDADPDAIFNFNFIKYSQRMFDPSEYLIHLIHNVTAMIIFSACLALRMSDPCLSQMSPDLWILLLSRCEARCYQDYAMIIFSACLALRMSDPDVKQDVARSLQCSALQLLLL